MPTLPQVLEHDFKTRYGLPAPDAALLTQERDTAFYFLTLVSANQLPATDNPSRVVSNLLINKLLPWSASTSRALADCPVSPEQWAIFLQLIESGQISSSSAYQRLFPALMETPAASPAVLAAEMNLLQSADTDFLEKLVDEVLTRFPDKVAEYRKGKKGLLALFMGEVMKASKGKAEPQATTRLLQERLK